MKIVEDRDPNFSRLGISRTVNTKDLKFCAKWTNDCQGKKDYDGKIISLLTRYWPDHTAVASIQIEFGDDPNEYGNDDYINVKEKYFQGNSEAEVKSLVEQWAQERFEKIVELIMMHIDII